VAVARGGMTTGDGRPWILMQRAAGMAMGMQLGAWAQAAALHLLRNDGSTPTPTPTSAAAAATTARAGCHCLWVRWVLLCVACRREIKSITRGPGRKWRSLAP